MWAEYCQVSGGAIPRPVSCIRSQETWDPVPIAAGQAVVGLKRPKSLKRVL